MNPDYSSATIDNTKNMNPKAIESPALTRKAKNYPARYEGKVPWKVRMFESVYPDLHLVRNVGLVAAKGQTYEVWVNSNGAVGAIIGDRMLGLKPDEFEVVEWHPTNTSPLYPLFEHLSREHGLTCTEDEMNQICRIVLKIKVPHSWLDPLLNGPTAVLPDKAGKWGCDDIERLLNAIRNR